MTGTQALDLQSQLDRARTLCLTGTRPYRYARMVAGDRSKGPVDRERAATELGLFCDAREAIEVSRQEARELSTFASTHSLRDLSFSKSLADVHALLRKTPSITADAEKLMVVTSELIGKLGALKARFLDTVEKLNAHLQQLSTNADDQSIVVRISQIRSRLRFNIDQEATVYDELSQPAAVKREGLEGNTENNRLLRYRAALIERAQTTLPQEETQLFVSAIDAVARRADNLLNRRVLWAILHQLRRRLFGALETVHSGSAISEDSTRPPVERPIPNFWGAFHRLIVLQESDREQAWYFLSQLLDAINAPETERVSKTAVICNMLESLPIELPDEAVSCHDTAFDSHDDRPTGPATSPERSDETEGRL